jgi:hypothetical protein
VDDLTRERLVRWTARSAALILGLGVLAALVVPLWSVDADIDEQVALTEELRDILRDQLAVTEELVAASLPVLESADPVLGQLEGDLPELRRLIDESLPLLATLQAETLPRVHRLVDESLPLQRRAVELGEESLVIQREALTIARATLEEVRETNRRLAALEPATVPAETVD